MPYELAFHPEALREWRTLSTGIREQFRKKLAERLIEPRIPAKLWGSTKPLQNQTSRCWISPRRRGA
jgi:mRNA interferase RelE/StbE